MTDNLKIILDEYADKFNCTAFISSDPIQIPHQYKRLQDIEITAFWTAILSWGNRTTIIKKATELFERMDNDPYRFIVNHSEKERQPFLSFKHRTFQADDALYFLEFFQQYYRTHESLEDAFLCPVQHVDVSKDKNVALNENAASGGDSLPDMVSLPGLTNVFSVERALTDFQPAFFSYDGAMKRTKKHIASPVSKSTCKRLNMFLRWMVRKDDRGVDFGLWNRISPADLMTPLDVHVERHARRLGLIERKQTDWLTVKELTGRLKEFDPVDPVRYDFALFGMGVMNY